MSKRNSRVVGMKLGLPNQLLMKTMNSTFYTPIDALRQDAKAQLDAIRNFKPAIEIDKSEVMVETKVMTSSEKAFMLARKYMNYDFSYTLKRIWIQHKKKEMNQATINKVHEIVNEIKATKTRPDTN